MNDRLEVINIIDALIHSITRRHIPDYSEAEEAIKALRSYIDTKIIEARIDENQHRPGYRYLSKEVKKERKFIYDQLQNGNLTQLLHAQLDDVYRWFEARLPVAKLIDKDRIAELQKELDKLEKG